MRKIVSLQPKMIQKYRHIIIAFFIANLLVSNIGLSVNWMYCYCKGQMQVSLFSLDDKCKEDDKKDVSCCKTSHCEKDIKPCCKKFEKYKKTEKPCTQKGKKYFKADLKYLFSEKDDNIKQPIECELIPYFFKFQEETTFLSEKIFSTQASNAPPPKRYGRNLLSFIQNFRC